MSKKLVGIALLALVGCTSTPVPWGGTRISLMGGPEIKEAEYVTVQDDTVVYAHLKGYDSHEVEGGRAALNGATAIAVALTASGVGAPAGAAVGGGIGAGTAMEIVQKWLKKKPAASNETAVVTGVPVDVQTNYPTGREFIQTTQGLQWDPNLAVEDIMLRSVKRVGAGLVFDWDCPTALGLEGKSMEGGAWHSFAGCQAWTPVGQGQYRGGWFDHCMTEDGCKTQRNLTNIADNDYWGAGHDLPAGSLVNIMSTDGKHRSALVAVE